MNASHYAKAKQAYYQKHGGTNKTQQATLSSPRPRPYGPRSTRHLQAQWRAVATTATGREASIVRAATQFACSNGPRPGTGRWYAAALWSYNQH